MRESRLMLKVILSLSFRTNFQLWSDNWRLTTFVATGVLSLNLRLHGTRVDCHALSSLLRLSRSLWRRSSYSWHRIIIIWHLVFKTRLLFKIFNGWFSWLFRTVVLSSQCRAWSLWGCFFGNWHCIRRRIVQVLMQLLRCFILFTKRSSNWFLKSLNVRRSSRFFHGASHVARDLIRSIHLKIYYFLY